MNENFLESVTKINFIKRPIPVPYNYRIMYKIAQIVIIIGLCCRRGGCSLIKLHLVSWGLNSKKEMDNLSQFANTDKVTTSQYIRFDPALNRGVAFAIAENIIIQQPNGKYKISEKGFKFFTEIMNDQELLTIEKSYLNSISSKLPESKIEALVADWRIHT